MSVTAFNTLEYCTKLDSHANMVILGRNFFVFDGVNDCTCYVEPFDPSIETANNVPIFDAAFVYTSPPTQNTYVLIAINE